MPGPTIQIDTGSANTTYTVVGLSPNKQYQFSVKPKNIIGLGPDSTPVTATTAVQAVPSTPSRVQSASFRSDAPSANATITLSLPSVPSAANKIFVIFNGYAGTGSNSAAITAPAGATLITGPNYESSEVIWAWQLQQSSNTSNSFTFSNFDNQNNAGWRIFELANIVNYDFTHGTTQVSNTAITWPLTAPVASNHLRLTLLAVEFALTVAPSQTNGMSVVTGDLVTTSPYHQGILLNVPTGVTTGSLAVTGGPTSVETDGFLSFNFYGASLPTQVTNLTATNVTSTAMKLSWNAVPNVSSYTIMYQGGGVTTFTEMADVPATSTTSNLTGLIPSTTYVFNVFASNASGQGPASTNLTIATNSIQSLLVVQSAKSSDTVGGTGLSTLTATFASTTTVGNLLAFWYTGFADPVNLALAPPSNASNSTGIVRDNGSSSDPISMFWTQPVTSATASYSFGSIDDAGSLIVVELQGVTSVGTPTHAGNLAFTDGAGGSLTLPVTAPTTTPGLGLYGIHMTNTPDTWGTPPSGISLLQGIVSGGTPSYHQGAVFSATSAVTTGNKTIPYTLGGSITQLSPPTYIGVNFYGVSGATAPGQVTVTLGISTSSSVALSWGVPTGSVTSYTVQYRITGQSTWSTDASGLTSTSRTVTGLTAATSYDFQVIAYNGSTAGPSSAVVQKATLASAPAQVTGLALGTATTTTQALTWTVPSGSPTSYTVQYKLATDSAFTNQTGITTNAATITGLTPNSSYVYQVFALSGTNAGPVSTTVVGSTLALTAPGQPTGVTLGTPGDVSQGISWTASTGTVTSYVVNYSSSSNTGPWTAKQGITSTSTTITGLTPSTVYYYQVIAYNGTTPSAASVVVNATTATATPPGAVTGLTLGTTASTTQALSWTAATGSVTSYTLQYKVVGAGSFTNVTGITTTSYTLTGLAPATSYIYQVFALNTTVAGSASATVTAQTLTAQGTAGSQFVTLNGKLLVIGGKFVIA